MEHDDEIGPLPPREEISAILVRIVELIGTSDGYSWSTWDDRDDALRELHQAAREVREGKHPTTLHVLFLPTGDLQEVSMESGWSKEYMALSERFDRALQRLSTRS